MYRLYTPVNFKNEVSKLLSRVEYSIELLTSEDDLLIFSKELYSFLEKNAQADIIICSKTKKKSIRIFNVISRLSELGARVFWLIDDNIDKLKSHFLIFDKTTVVSRLFYNSENSTEKQVMYFSNIFSKIMLKAEIIEPQVNKIKAKISVDNSIVERNHIVELKWDIENADTFNISPALDINTKRGKMSLQLQSDTMFKLTASNKNEYITKFLFVKVINDKKINIDVKVFDPFTERYIYLSPVINKKSKKYYCYNNQSVIISWDFKEKVELFEKKIGKLKVKDEYSFIINEKKNFQIIFDVNNKKVTQNLFVIPSKDKIITKPMTPSSVSSSPLKKFNNLISNFFLKK